VRQLALEPGVDHRDGLVPELGRALGEFARFNGCERIVFENMQSKMISAPLKRALH